MARGKNQLFQKSPTKSNLQRTTFFISDQNDDFLIELCYKVRKSSGTRLSKSEIVRALIELAQERKIDFRKIESVEDLKNAIVMS